MNQYLMVVALTVASMSQAADLTARAEGGFSTPLSATQQKYLSHGGHVFGTVGVQLNRYLDAFGQLGAILLSAKPGSGVTNVATGFFFGAGGRLRYPTAFVAPWLEAAIHFQVTGSLPRMSFTGGVGLGIRFSEDSSFWFGPAIRYFHVFKLVDQTGYVNADASILCAGLYFEFDGSAKAPEPVDTDGDGVIDSKDACPTEAGKGVDGCPVVEAPKAQEDADNDGIVGAADQCPDRAEDRDNFQDEDGCPEADNDGDTILDGADECPNQAGAVKAKGCPDSDDDGVADRADECPKVAGVPEKAGCPDRKAQLINITTTKIELKQKIFFAFGKTTILPKSFPLLNEVSQALSDRSHLCVRIEGHTDNVGSDAKNMILSQGRADAIKTYLAEHAIDTKRMESKGYGSTLPLETNATVDGREANRRVEFVIQPCTE